MIGQQKQPTIAVEEDVEFVTSLVRAELLKGNDGHWDRAENGGDGSVDEVEGEGGSRC